MTGTDSARRRQLALIAILLSSSVAIVSCSSAPAVRQNAWIGDVSAACRALSIGWDAEKQTLQEIVGANYRPATHESEGSGLLILSLVSCDDSSIDNRSSGPFSVAFITISLDPAVRPQAIRILPDAGLVSLPLVIGDSADAVVQLFAGQDFINQHGAVRLDIRHSDGGLAASGTIRFADGEFDVIARFVEAASAEQRNVAAVGTHSQRFNVVTGSISSTSRRSSSAMTGISGVTVLSDLELAAAPRFAYLDTDFGWALYFSQYLLDP